MLGFGTEAARKGATHARRENPDPINLVQSIMNEFPTIGIDEICRRVDAAIAHDRNPGADPLEVVREATQHYNACLRFLMEVRR